MQLDDVLVWQVPVPSHVRAGVNVDPVQDAATQVVPATYSRHAPAPLQKPSVPQVPAPWVAHWVVGTGACPAGMLEHVPGEPATAHDRQVPVQVVRQQTPCSQKPELH